MVGLVLLGVETDRLHLLIYFSKPKGISSFSLLLYLVVEVKSVYGLHELGAHISNVVVELLLGVTEHRNLLALLGGKHLRDRAFRVKCVHF